MTNLPDIPGGSISGDLYDYVGIRNFQKTDDMLVFLSFE